MRITPVLYVLWLAVGLLVLAALTSCKSAEYKSEVRKDIWMHEPLSTEACAKYPGLREIGIYRKLKSGKEEFVSYCKPEIEKYLSIHIKQLQKWEEEIIKRCK